MNVLTLNTVILEKAKDYTNLIVPNPLPLFFFAHYSVSTGKFSCHGNFGFIMFRFKTAYSTTTQTLNSGCNLNTDSKRTTTLLLSSFNVMPIIDCKNCFHKEHR